MCGDVKDVNMKTKKYRWLYSSLGVAVNGKAFNYGSEGREFESLVARH